MFTLRCTKTLLKRIKVKPDPVPPPPTTRLGDWYANILFTRPKHLVLCVSERTLMPLLLEASDPSTLGHRLRQALIEALDGMGIAKCLIGAEEGEMTTIGVSTTASRTILGSMNDFAQMVAYYSSDLSPMAIALKLAESPCSPIGMASPRQATIDLFGEPRLRIVK